MENPDLPLKLDLIRVIHCLEEALELADELDGIETKVDDPSVRKSNQHLGSLSNQLRRLADLCQTASGEATMVYWGLKGNRDPRDGRQS